MPIYEYRRPDGSTFEVQQSFSDDPLTHDPGSGVPVTRVFHAPAVHFKGSGFYNTDYGTRKRQREGTSGDEKGSSGSSGDSGGDSASATSSKADGDGAARKGAGEDKSAKRDESKGGAKKPLAATG